VLHDRFDRSPGVSAISLEHQCPSHDQFTQLVANHQNVPAEFQEHLKSCQKCRRDWLDYQRDREMRRFQSISAWLLGAVLATMVLIEIYRSCHASH
jgi:hypothetical protein